MFCFCSQALGLWCHNHIATFTSCFTEFIIYLLWTILATSCVYTVPIPLTPHDWGELMASPEVPLHVWKSHALVSRWDVCDIYMELVRYGVAGGTYFWYVKTHWSHFTDQTNHHTHTIQQTHFDSRTGEQKKRSCWSLKQKRKEDGKWVFRSTSVFACISHLLSFCCQYCLCNQSIHILNEEELCACHTT